ncbi:protein of unknown function [Streptomyces murinus]
MLGRGRNDQQLPGQRHPYALRDLQCAHSCVRFLELVRDRRIELELAVVSHAQIVPSGASCRLPRGQLPPQMAFQALADGAILCLIYPSNALHNTGS